MLMNLYTWMFRPRTSYSNTLLSAHYIKPRALKMSPTGLEYLAFYCRIRISILLFKMIYLIFTCNQMILCRLFIEKLIMWDDKIIVQGCKKGKRKAQTALYDKYSDSMRSINHLIFLFKYKPKKKRSIVRTTQFTYSFSIILYKRIINKPTFKITKTREI